MNSRRSTKLDWICDGLVLAFVVGVFGVLATKGCS